MIKKRNGFLFTRVASLALVVTCFSSCLKSTVSNNTPNTPSTYISLLHLAPYTPPVDVYFNGTSASQSVDPDTYFVSYSKVAPGTYDIKFQKYGGDSLVAEIPAYTYDSLNFYTLILYNTAHDSTKAAVIKDNFTNVTSTYSYYRFFNMNPDLRGVDVYLSNSLAQGNRKPADNVNPSSTYNYFQGIQPGYYSVLIKAAGTDSLITSATSVDLAAGNVYTFLLTGKGTVSTFNVLQGTY